MTFYLSEDEIEQIANDPELASKVIRAAVKAINRLEDGEMRALIALRSAFEDGMNF